MHEAPETLYRTLGTREWELQGSLFGECLWINPTAHVRLRLKLTICSWLGRDSASKTHSQVVLRKNLEIVSNEVSDQPWKFQGSDAGEHSNRIKFRTWDRKTSTGYWL